MKTKYIYLICIMIFVLAIIAGIYYSYKQKIAEIYKYNLEYIQYSEREIFGTELATVINKAIDSNIRNDVNTEILQKDNRQIYIYTSNETNSINIDIKITENATTYRMESLYQGDLEKFIQNFNDVLFECTNIKYHKNGKVKYMHFQQIIK